MKDLGVANHILGMRIMQDRFQGILKLSQGMYIGKVLNRFRDQNVTSSNTPLGSHFKLLKK